MKAIYKAGDIILLGLRSLTAHKFRSLLSVLGILFGVWSVIAMLAINEGARYEAERALRQLGTDKLVCNSVKPAQEATAAARDRGALHYGLTHADVRRLCDNLPGVVRYSTAHESKKTVQYANRLIQARILGVSPGYFHLRGLQMWSGRALTASDELRGRNVAVTTQSFARRLFQYEDPLGKTLFISGDAFVVVGLIERPASLAAETPEEMLTNIIFIPAGADLTRFGEYAILVTESSQEREKVEVSQVIFQMADEPSVLAGARVAQSLMESWHEDRDYEVSAPLELIEQRRKQRRLWNIMFFAIASISLLVGGIGITNIMLASVTERTREIGIRRALGARRRDITMQFLAEAVTLTALGGLAGIALGYVVPPVVEGMLKIKAILSPEMLAVPFLMAVVVGLVSGLYPAVRAAGLDPIIALRHE